MKTFKEFLTEAKPFTKKGKMFVLKEPKTFKQRGKEFEVLAVGRDTNGNPLMRVVFDGKKKSIQIPYSVTISIQTVVDGLDNKQIKEILDELMVRG